MERFSSPLPLEFKAAGDDGEGVIAGYASTFGNVDSYGDVVERGCFQASLQERWPVALWSHNPHEVIGRWVECAEDAKGLRVVGRLNMAVRRGRECYEHLKAADCAGLSIGYSVAKNGCERGPDGLTTRLKAVHLFEISVVAVAANPFAKVESVKSAFGTRDELEVLLRQVVPLRAARRLAAVGWREFSGEDEPDPEALARFDERIDERIARATRQLKGL